MKINDYRTAAGTPQALELQKKNENKLKRLTVPVYPFSVPEQTNQNELILPWRLTTNKLHLCTLLSFEEYVNI